jgi:hypothetical protein
VNGLKNIFKIIIMTKNQLLKRQEDYYKKVNEWFVSQLAKWSKKHNAYVQDYSILRMWFIDAEEEEYYEPYSRYRNEELDEKYEDALKDYQALVDDLVELGVSSWQGLEYSDEAQFLH